MSNMSRPIRPGRCTWAIAAARWSAMRWPACSKQPGFASPANIMSTMPAAQVDTLARSVHLRYREALGEDIGEIPEGMYPGDYLHAGRRSRSPREYRRPNMSARPKPNGCRCSAQGGRGDARPDPRRSRPARHPPRRVRVRSRAAGSRAPSTRRWRRCAPRAWSTRACSKRPRARPPTIGSRSS